MLDVLGDAVTGDRAAELLQEADGSPRRAVNAFFDQSKASAAPADDDVQSSPAQQQPLAEPAAKQATGKRKAPASASGGKKAGGGSKKAKQQQSDVNQRSITAFFTRSPSGKAAAPVPAQHRRPADPEAMDPTAAVKQEPHATVKQESAVVSQQQTTAEVKQEPVAEQVDEVCTNAVCIAFRTVARCKWWQQSVHVAK